MKERLLEITFIGPPRFGLVLFSMEARTQKQGKKKASFFVDFLSPNFVMTVVKVNARSQKPSLINCFDIKNGTIIN